MSLTSSLFSGVSGLSAMGNAMTVIGDNIANVNTIGFKSSRVTFQDVLSQTVATNSGSAQVGRGTSVGEIAGQFAQGSFESTESPTDLAIGGEGFFIVRHPKNESEQYFTRAGEFRFDKDGNFTTPSGYITQGWSVRRNEATGDVEDVGSIQDIQLESFTSPPEKTNKISIITNLDARGKDNTVGPGVPLATAWDGRPGAGINISDLAFEYQTTVKAFDALGSTHDLTLYFDKGAGDGSYEYIVTCNPEEDMRDIFNSDEDRGRGLLGRGTLNFTTDGLLASQTFERFVGNSGGNLAVANSSWTSGTPKVSGDWSGDPAVLAGGPPATETYTFTVAPPAASADPAADAAAGGGIVVGTNPVVLNWTAVGSGKTGTISVPGDFKNGNSVEGPDGIILSLEEGTDVASGSTFDVVISAGDPNALDNADGWSDMSGDFQNQHFTVGADFLGGSNRTTEMDIELDMGIAYDGSNWAPAGLSSTQFASASTTVFQSASGYGAGSLQNISVDVDGIITGQYSNGQVTPLFRVALGKFQNVQGLFKEGGNLFSETRLSGSVITNRPGTNGLGSLAPNSLEQSNVDMASEFVKMITNQRAYQANSKIVTTVDTMLGDTISMKR
ncbi:flagellar hook protein FlgE [Desulfoluna spongiiphila]|uniref:Flagellar hook protein FlgE n=1 Tax=Desulfoluna spongiiphila TaxID=419481 RepID=A0A1G5AK26_9BACT|nr:flagellar hook-basal body complex protein [Desulfoluna spongiiphila]SCX78266.1 flagellar hook-basal body protein [Desulfoluna spongiiphila]VVS90522.1 flagellar hook-basal body protein flge/f/g [Desulfoluna spongiiphila]